MQSGQTKRSRPGSRTTWAGCPTRGRQQSSSPRHTHSSRAPSSALADPGQRQDFPCESHRRARGFLEHLIQGDDAPTEIGVGYKLHLALRNGRAAELKTAVAELLIENKIDLATLASRIVYVGTYGGADGYHLSPDFEQEVFNVLAPDEDDPWYDLESLEDLDPKDLSWANRRKFAQGRARRPS